MTATSLVLASTSPFRRALLERLGIPFVTANPNLDETPLHNEPPQVLALRLAEAKARAAVAAHPDALIIGSDQVACLGEQILGKPGNRAQAIRQLEAASGHCMVFQTGLCLFDAAHNHAQTIVEPFRVHFRTLTRTQIEGYVDRERPFSCAGSFKSEGLGIALFERLEGEDPTALVGLPLIRLVSLLEAYGIHPLGA